MADNLLGNINFGIEGILGGISIVILLSVIAFLMWGLFLWFSFNQSAVIITAKHKPPILTRVKKVKYKDNSYEWSIRGKFIENILGRNPRAQIEFNVEDCVWFSKVGINEYRQLDVEKTLEGVKFKEIISPLAREKFLKHNRLIAMTFRPPESFLEKSAPYILFAIFVLGSIFIYDGINKASIEVAKQNSASTAQVASSLEKIANGTTQLEFCKQVWGVSRFLNTQQNGSVVYTPLPN